MLAASMVGAAACGTHRGTLAPLATAVTATPTIGVPLGPRGTSLANSAAAESLFLSGNNQSFTFDKVFTNQTDPRGLGSFSFDVDYDPNVFERPSVDLSPAQSLFIGSRRTLNCSIAPTVGVSHVECISPGPGGAGPTFVGSQILAHVTMLAVSSVVKAIRPQAGNGISSDIHTVHQTASNTCGQALNDGASVAQPDQQECQGSLLGGVRTDGQLPDSSLHVTVRRLEGDVVPDCKVDLQDLQVEAERSGLRDGDPLYSSFFNLVPAGASGDGEIGSDDVQFVFSRLGSTCENPIPPQPPPAPASK